MGFRFSGTTGKVNLMSKYGATNQDQEMIPVVLAAALWGQTWKGKIVCFNSDSQAGVEVL